MPRRFSVRRSTIHGRGVFALTRIEAGEQIAPFRGEVSDHPAAATTGDAVACPTGHTFCFGLSDGKVVDGAAGGNSMRWLNHSCAPNCEAWEQDGAIVIMSVRDIAAGEELVIDYQLEVDAVDRTTGAFDCRCRTEVCRGDMLAG